LGNYFGFRHYVSLLTYHDVLILNVTPQAQEVEEGEDLVVSLLIDWDGCAARLIS